MLARAFKRMGHDVIFIVNYSKKYQLNRPENRYDDIPYPYPDWIIEAQMPSLLHYITSNSSYVKYIKALVDDCDIIFLNDIGHLLSNFLRKDIIRINMSTGSDLEIKADYGSMVKNTFKRKNLAIELLKLPIKLYYTYLLRQGFQKANIISYFPKGIVPDGDIKLNKLIGTRNISTTWLQMAEIDLIKFSDLPNNTIPIIFNVCRFEWGESASLINSWTKGNDIMIKGIALFYHKTKMPLNIHFVEKGSSVDATKELIKEKDIEHLVTWHKEMTQKEVNEWYVKSNIVFEQLGTHFVGMGGLDALALGRPVIANSRTEIFDPLLGESSKYCNATDENKVADWLEKLLTNKEFSKTIAKEGRLYVENHFSPDSHAQKFLKMLADRGELNFV